MSLSLPSFCILYRKHYLLRSFFLLVVSLFFQGLSAQPVIQSFAPLSGAPGTVVTITGGGFDAAAANNAVFFGATRAAVTNANGTSLTVIAPYGASCQPITVTSNGFTAYSSASFSITFAGGGALSADAFTPAGGYTTGRSPYSAATGDFDGDDKPDIVTIDGGYPYTVSVFRNTSSGGTISFAKNGSLTPGVVPFDAAVGDVNGDGKLDLVVTNSGSALSYSISVFKNTSTTGAISFAPGEVYETGGNPTSVCIRDLDLDGRPDIAMTNFISRSISVFRNTGSGGVVSFAPRQDYNTGSYPSGIAAGDLDRDGKPELAVTNSGSNTVYVFPNTSTPGNISLGSSMYYGAGSNSGPNSIRIHDMDGDGAPDMVVSNTSSSKVAVFRSLGNRIIAFAGRQEFSLPNPPGHFSIADLDGDSRPDLALSGSKLLVVRNNSVPGNVSFDQPVIINSGKQPDNITVADFDGDAMPELVTVSQSDSAISIFSNAVTGPNVMSFAPDTAASGATVTIKGTNFTGATAVSFGGKPAVSYSVRSDSIITAVVGDGASGAVQVTTAVRSGMRIGFVHLPKPVVTSFTPVSGSRGTPVTITGTALVGATAVTFGGVPAKSFTVMNDTSIVAIAGEGASGGIGVTTPNGSGYTPGFTYITTGEPPVINSFTPSSGPVGTVVTINGANFSSNPVANIVYFGPVRARVLSASSTQLTVSVPLGANCDPLTVTTNRLTGRTVKTFIVTFSGGSGFTASSFKPVVYFATRLSPYHSVVCDLDGDGRPDIAAASYPQASVLRNTSRNGVLSFDSKVDIQTGAGSHITAGDLDGDGKQDLVVSTQYSDIIILKNVSTPGKLAFVDTIILPAAKRLNSAAVADLDGDGRPEIIAVTEDAPNIMVFWNISLNGVIAFAPPIKIPTGRMPYDVKAGDLDGDGKADLVVAQYQDNNVSVFRNTSAVGSISFAARAILASGDRPWSTGIGDLDADGKPELFVASTTAYKNFVHLYKNNSTPGVIAFEPSNDYIGGTSTNDAQMGDLDGDGKPDLASTNGSPWYQASFYRNISNNNTIALDTPALRIELKDPLMNVALADLNGDGKPDLSGAQLGADRVMVMENNIGAGLSPLISAFTPANAATDSVVTIKGKRFTGVTAVSFGGVPAASFIVVSDSLITAVVGTGASGLLSVTASNGSAALDGFTYTAPVSSVTSLFPDSGASGAIINITGRRFSDVTSVSFGGVPAASFSVISDSLIAAVVGAGASGSVAVSTLYDTVSLAGFIYIPPPAPVVTSFTPASGITGTVVKVRGSNFNTATQVLFGGAAAASFVMDSSTSITAVVGSGASGPVSVITGGGTSSLAGFTYVPPAPVVVSFTPTSAGTGATVRITGNNFNGVTLVSFGGVPATSFVVESPTSIAAVVGNGASGTVNVTASGGAGSLDGFIYKFPVPAITSFTPVSATTGATVRITGSNLTGATQVLLGGVPAASFVVESSTAVVAVVGSGASGNVSVTTAGGTAMRAGFTYVPPAPVISSFTPLSATKGAIVKISGSNFTGLTEVRFGGVRAASFVVDSSTGITAVVGNGASGAVSVSNSGGNSSLNGFTFISTTPDITSFTPVSATTGETITIRGVNFTSVTQVWFGELPAASFNLGSSTTITAVVGSGTSGTVWVVANGDTARLYGFTYTAPVPPAPVINAITPASAATGTTIKISGNNFTGATHVLLGGVPAASFTVDSSTGITAVVGNGASGAVTVVTPAGTSSYPGFVFIVPVAPSQPLVAFPNPVVNGILHVKHPASTKTSHVLLFDMNGVAIRRIAVAPGETQTDVNVGGLLSGMYQVIWTDEDQRLRQTIVVP